jgi:hypothetical protein
MAVSFKKIDMLNAGPWLRDVSIVSEQGGNGRQPALFLAFY